MIIIFVGMSLQRNLPTKLSKYLKWLNATLWKSTTPTPDTTPPEIRAAERVVNRKLARYQDKRQELAPAVPVTEQEKLIDLLG